MNTKQVTAYYDSIPTVPQDFDGAVAVHAIALKAIYFWKEERKHTMYTIARNNASAMVTKWERCKDEASKVIASYQLPLF